MSDQEAGRRHELLLEQWKMASELHRHEDDLTWQRFGHFCTVTGILAAGAGVVWSSAPIERSLWAVAGIALAGFLVSVAWCLIQARAKAWHAYRIKQADEAEKELAVAGKRVLTIYASPLEKQALVKPHWWAHFSTNTIMLLLEGLFAVVWLIAFLHQVDQL